GAGPADAGVAWGLTNPSRKIGGSIALAAVTTVAATATGRYAHSHALPAVSSPALAHGFQVAFYALIGLALVGAAIAATFVEPKPRDAAAAEPAEPAVALEQAA